MNSRIEQKHTILVIDDKPENIKLLLKVLTEAGYETLMAKDGIRGLQRATYAKPDLILLDIMMPEISGFEVCKQLKQQPETQDIPVIFMSALQDTIDKIEGFSLGAADYITKPFHHEEVLARIKTHLQLYNLQCDLKQRNLELDTFSRSVAHDLKNPLNIMINYAELLCQQEAGTVITPEMYNHFAAILRAGLRMTSTIDELMTLVGLSKMEVKLTTLDMDAIVKQVLQDRLILMLEKTQAQIDLPDSWPPALGHAPWIEEVWMNYISNGLKYGGHPPHLTLGAEQKTPHQVCFWIEDNGPGIDEHLQQQLFKPFTRAAHHETDGYGLGLSIVQQIIHKLNGEIGVESCPGQGSRFYFCLPSAEALAPTPQPSNNTLPVKVDMSLCDLSATQLQRFDNLIDLGDISGLDVYVKQLLSAANTAQQPCLQYLKQLTDNYQLETLKNFLHSTT